VYRLRREVDELVCLETPLDFGAVSSFYAHFLQTGDSEVIHLLEAAWHQDQSQNQEGVFKT
jgi:putative phosphoribosyl transferase